MTLILRRRGIVAGGASRSAGGGGIVAGVGRLLLLRLRHRVQSQTQQHPRPVAIGSRVATPMLYNCLSCGCSHIGPRPEGVLLAQGPRRIYARAGLPRSVRARSGSSGPAAHLLVLSPITSPPHCTLYNHGTAPQKDVRRQGGVGKPSLTVARCGSLTRLTQRSHCYE